MSDDTNEAPFPTTSALLLLDRGLRLGAITADHLDARGYVAKAKSTGNRSVPRRIRDLALSLSDEHGLSVDGNRFKVTSHGKGFTVMIVASKSWKAVGPRLGARFKGTDDMRAACVLAIDNYHNYLADLEAAS